MPASNRTAAQVTGENNLMNYYSPNDIYGGWDEWDGRLI
jgi:hypothetical protein